MTLHSLLFLPLALLLALLLSACDNHAEGDTSHPEDSTLSVSIVEDEAASASGTDSDPAEEVDVYPLPFTEQEDVSDAYTPMDDVPWGEGELVTLNCTNLAVDAYAAGEEPVTVSGAGSQLLFSCTWTEAELTVYVGVLDEDGICYYLPLTGGSAAGVWNLSGLPAGRYTVFLISSNNEEGETSLVYQMAE
ncbi:MAG: hypothetical protein LUG55_09085 [Clostridiales bacterium]|nr:hypothetical protein [Clostridiales bacterium]